MPRGGGTISLAPSPGSLVRLAFLCRTNFPVRSATSLEARVTLKWHSRKDLHPQPPRSKRGALSIELREHEWCLRWDLHPRWAGFEAAVSAAGLHRRRRVLPVSLALTLTPGLSRRPLLWATEAGNWCPRRELHPHLTASETVISAVGLLGHESGSLGWIRTTNPPLQRRMLSLLSYKAE